MYRCLSIPAGSNSRQAETRGVGVPLGGCGGARVTGIMGGETLVERTILWQEAETCYERTADTQSPFSKEGRSNWGGVGE